MGEQHATDMLELALRVFASLSPAVIALLVAMANRRQAVDRRAADRRTLLLAEQRLQLDLLDRRVRSLDELESIHRDIHAKADWSPDDLLHVRAAVERCSVLYPAELAPDFRAFIDHMGIAQNRLASGDRRRAQGDEEGADIDLLAARQARNSARYDLRLAIDRLRFQTRVVLPAWA